MRKHLIAPIPQSAPALNEGWLDLDGATVVEVTSEEKKYPVESALVPGETRGWRAAASGTQTVRLIFDDLMRRVLPSQAFARWLRTFMPQISTSGDDKWLQPVVSPDPSDPKLAHLDGLNLSRA